MQLELNATQLNLIWIKIPKLNLNTLDKIHIELNCIWLNWIKFNSIQFNSIQIDWIQTNFYCTVDLPSSPSTTALHHSKLNPSWYMFKSKCYYESLQFTNSVNSASTFQPNKPTFHHMIFICSYPASHHQAYLDNSFNILIQHWFLWSFSVSHLQRNAW